MKVFATNYFETMTDDVDGGKDWNWDPKGYKGTDRGRPTNTDTTTKPTSPNPDQVSDQDTAAESTNSVDGAMVA